MSPIATPAISAKPQCELAGNQGAEKPFGEDSSVTHTYLENCWAKSRPPPQARNPIWPKSCFTTGWTTPPGKSASWIA